MRGPRKTGGMDVMIRAEGGRGQYIHVGDVDVEFRMPLALVHVRALDQRLVPHNGPAASVLDESDVPGPARGDDDVEAPAFLEHAAACALDWRRCTRVMSVQILDGVAESVFHFNRHVSVAGLTSKAEVVLGSGGRGEVVLGFGGLLEIVREGRGDSGAQNDNGLSQNHKEEEKAHFGRKRVLILVSLAEGWRKGCRRGDVDGEVNRPWLWLRTSE